MGGKYAYSECERYNINHDVWVKIAPMKIGRYDHSIVDLHSGRYLYILGGHPLEVVGKTMERYNVDYDFWETMPVQLLLPVANVPLVHVSENAFAILGGRFSSKVFMMTVNIGALEDEDEGNNFEVNEESFKI